MRVRLHTCACAHVALWRLAHSMKGQTVCACASPEIWSRVWLLVITLCCPVALQVRQAMLELASSLEPAADASGQQQANASGEHAGSQEAAALAADEAAVLAASQQLAAAVGHLPLAEHLSDFAARLCTPTGSGTFATAGGLQAAGGGAAAAAGMAAKADAEEASASVRQPSPSSPSSLLGQAVAASAAAGVQVVGRWLQQVGIPPPDKPHVRQKVEVRLKKSGLPLGLGVGLPGGLPAQRCSKCGTLMPFFSTLYMLRFLCCRLCRALVSLKATGSSGGWGWRRLTVGRKRQWQRGRGVGLAALGARRHSSCSSTCWK